jgi:hypothetical protein
VPRFAPPISAPAARQGAAARSGMQPARPVHQRSALWHTLQLKAAKAASASAAAEARSGLPGPLKAGIERLSGIAMNDVRVHRNSSEPAKLGALAYAKGSDIHLGPGQERHLPHEAWHVVQQKQGRVRPTVQMMDGATINDDAGLEREADVMGARASAAAEPPLRDAPEEGLDWGPASPVAQMHVGAPYQFNLTDFAKWTVRNTVGTAWDVTKWAASNLKYGAEEGLVKVGAYSVKDESGNAAEADMGDDYHAEDNIADVAEEQIKPGDLSLGALSHRNHAELGKVVAEQNPESYVNYKKLAANNWSDAGFLKWYNSGPVTRGWFARQPAREPVQKKRGPGDSYQESYPTQFGDFKEVTYTRDSQGTIDFNNPKSHKVWKPACVNKKSQVELSKGSGYSTHGVGARGLIPIAKASRAQHFWLANSIMGNNHGNSSPPDWTWHHLPKPYKMVLVDRGVHRKHGHNGGKLLWS